MVAFETFLLQPNNCILLLCDVAWLTMVDVNPFPYNFEYFTQKVENVDTTD